MQPSPFGTTHVTKRELQVLELVAAGNTTATIGQQLGVSPRTVDAHRLSLMRKFKVRTGAQMVIAATRAGIIAPRHALDSGKASPE